MRKLLLFLFSAPFLYSQSIQIFSEFQRVDPFGDILAMDRTPSAREIISPAAARNSFLSFHVAISAPPGQPYFLYTQANPAGILQLRLYKEQFVKSGGQWIPDALIATSSPSFGVIPDGQAGIPNQTSRDYLLDIWVPPDAEVGRRVRVEVLLKLGTFTIVPMEVRVTDAMVRPPDGAVAAGLPAIDEPADSAALHALAEHLAGVREWNGDAAPTTVRDILRRNAEQDMALATAEPTPAVWLRAGGDIVNRWGMFRTGAEWYLRVRDLLISRPRP